MCEVTKFNNKMIGLYLLLSGSTLSIDFPTAPFLCLFSPLTSPCIVLSRKRCSSQRTQLALTNFYENCRKNCVSMENYAPSIAKPSRSSDSTVHCLWVILQCCINCIRYINSSLSDRDSIDFLLLWKKIYFVSIAMHLNIHLLNRSVCVFDFSFKHLPGFQVSRINKFSQLVCIFIFACESWFYIFLKFSFVNLPM
jgi:hypothetical protein